MRFSLELIEGLLILAIVLIAVVARLRLVLVPIARVDGQLGLVQALSIAMWAIGGMVMIFDLLACLIPGR
jgi:hypothetical protein